MIFFLSEEKCVHVCVCKIERQERKGGMKEEKKKKGSKGGIYKEEKERKE